LLGALLLYCANNLLDTLQGILGPTELARRDWFPSRSIEQDDRLNGGVVENSNEHKASRSVDHNWEIHTASVHKLLLRSLTGRLVMLKRSSRPSLRASPSSYGSAGLIKIVEM
jgi:hypothetical protein